MNKVQEKLVDYIKAHPEETYSSIALMLGTTAPTITRIAQQAGLPPRGSKKLTIADIEKLEAK
jgi:DNA-binding MurR/RpiR family transcriptional regulator